MCPTKNHSTAYARHSQGFSFVELMVAMSIAMVVIAALLSSYTFLGRNLVRYSNQQQLEAQGRNTLQIFGKDVRMATDVTATYSASQVTLVVPRIDAAGKVITDGAGNVITKNVTYTYDTTGGNLTRTDPEINSGKPLTLLAGLPKVGGPVPLWSGFNYLDKQANPASNQLSIKQIEVRTFTTGCGTASAGTRSSFTGASARMVLRNKHLIK